jgi:hypothetical protein
MCDRDRPLYHLPLLPSVLLAPPSRPAARRRQAPQVQSLRQAFHAAAFARLDVQQQMPAGALHEASTRQAQQNFRGRKIPWDDCLNWLRPGLEKFRARAFCVSTAVVAITCIRTPTLCHARISRPRPPFARPEGRASSRRPGSENSWGVRALLSLLQRRQLVSPGTCGFPPPVRAEARASKPSDRSTQNPLECR